VVALEVLGRLLGKPVEELPPECRAMTTATPAARAGKPMATTNSAVFDPRKPAVVRVVGKAEYLS